MLRRRKESQKKEKDWFEFSSQLFLHLCADYIALRLLYYLEPVTIAPSILVKMVEVAEKSLKLYLTVHKKSNTALSDSSQGYGHNIEKMRAESAKYDKVFDDKDIKEFSKDLHDKHGELYQYLRYGSQQTTKGISANLSQIMPVIDKIFFKSIMLLPENERRMFNFTSPLKCLLTQSSFDQSQNPALLLSVLQKDNQYINEYAKYCNFLDNEHARVSEQLITELKMAKENPSSDLLPDIGNPATRALAAAGITRLEQVARVSEAELLKLHGVGPKAIRILKEALAERGLAFARPEKSGSISEQANRQIPRRAPKRSA